MENIQLITIATAVILLIVIIVFFNFRRNKAKLSNVEDINKEKKIENQRGNFRLRLDIEDALMEVIKIGESDVNESELCEIVDVSASGLGLYSKNDYPIREKVLVKLLFKLNDKEFSVDGVLVRKVEAVNKDRVLYGVNFMNLSDGNENKLLKEIAAIENSRRKISIR
jgi:c-di-GMP-binding flagellar brake protein YcgR